jgi:hypothetical protein
MLFFTAGCYIRAALQRMQLLNKTARGASRTGHPDCSHARYCSAKSERQNFRSARTFLALAQFEFNLLAIVQSFVA